MEQDIPRTREEIRIAIHDATWDVELKKLAGTILTQQNDDHWRVLAAVKDAAESSSICGVAWKRDTLIVTCKTCGLDPTCAICMPCFQAGNHEGHDYNIHESSGGMCDCGDPQAWATEGFCSKHSGGKEKVDPNDTLNPVMVDIARNLFEILMEKMMEHFLEDEHEGANIALIKWFYKLQKYGEGLRYLIGESMMLGGPLASPLSYIMMKIYTAKEEVQAAVVELFTALIVDFSFKKQFTSHYVQNYGKIVEEKERDRSLSALSVQLFTVSSIVLELSQRERLLDTLIEAYTRVLKKAEKDGGIDPTHKIIKKDSYFRVQQNVKYALQNWTVSQYVMWDNDVILRKLLDMLLLLHGSVPHTRETVIHILVEKLDCINLEFMLLKMISHLVSGLQYGPGVKDGPLPSLKEVFPRLKEIIQVCYDVLSSWFDSQKAQIFFSSQGHKVSRDPVSMQIPLHRSMAMFLRTCTSVWDAPITELLEFSDRSAQNFCRQLIEEPLRVNVMVSQIQNRMWIRNGQSMVVMAYLYRTSHGKFAHYSSSNDMYLLQVCATILGPQVFLDQALKTWQLQDYFNNIFELSEYLQPNVEDFLTFLLYILGDVSMIGLGCTEDATLRRLLVHFLASGAHHTHSVMEKSIPEPWNKLKSFDQILNSVANTSSNGGSVTYSLKNSCWSEFEGRNFPYYSARDLETAMTSFEQYIKETGSRSVRHPTLYSIVQNSDILPDDMRHRTATSFLPLVSAEWLHSNALLRLVRNSLKNFTEKMATAAIAEQALYILLLQISVEPRDDTDHNDFYSNITGVVGELSLLNLIMECSKHAELSNLASTVLKKLSEKNAYMAQLIEQAIPQKEGEDEISEKKRQQDARKMKLLAQMEEQRKKFASSVGGDDFDEDEEDETSTEMPQCCLCKEVCSGNEMISHICNIALAAKQIWDQRGLNQLGPNDSRMAANICGHLIHDQCHETYTQSLKARARANQQYEGKNYILPDQGEFLCPLCRKISNGLIPHTWEVTQHKGSSLRKSTLDWISVYTGQQTGPSQQAIEISKKNQNASYRSFSQRLMDINVKTPSETNPFKLMTQTLINTISSAELLLRDVDEISFHYELLNDRILDQIRQLILAGFSMNHEPARDLPRWDILETYWSVLFDCKLMRPTTVLRIQDVNHSMTSSEETPSTTSQPLGDGQSTTPSVQISTSPLDLDAFTIWATIMMSSPVLFDYQAPSDEFVSHLTKVMLRLVGAQSNDPKLEHSSCLPFLRKVLLFKKCWQVNNNDHIRNIGKKIVENFPEISVLLVQLLDDMEEDFAENFEKISQMWAGKLSTADPLPPALAFRFPELPEEFHSLLLSYDKKCCEKCQTPPSNLVFCLFCRSVLCLIQACCQNEQGEGEIVQHIDECSGGRGIIFIVRQCGIFVIKSRTMVRKKVYGSIWNSIYLDKYGEEDELYKRGKPLFLSKERLEQLRQLWLNGELPYQINQKSGLTSYMF